MYFVFTIGEKNGLLRSATDFYGMARYTVLKGQGYVRLAMTQKGSLRLLTAKHGQPGLSTCQDHHDSVVTIHFRARDTFKT